MTDILGRLFELRDEEYRAFSAALIPTVQKERIIGVRAPALRKLAKEIYRRGAAEAFMAELPHEYCEEDSLHAFLIGEIKDFSSCVEALDRFLPYVDNWAVCDSLRPAVLKKHRAELLEKIREWIKSGHCYTCRFGIEMLMCHFLDEDFREEYLDWANVSSGEYYVRMMTAWFFATALAKQYEAALPYIEEGRLEKWTHNKAIQKAVESFRVNTGHKTYLKTLKK